MYCHCTNPAHKNYYIIKELANGQITARINSNEKFFLERLAETINIFLEEKGTFVTKESEYVVDETSHKNLIKSFLEEKNTLATKTNEDFFSETSRRVVWLGFAC